MRSYEDLIRELGTKAEVEQGSDEWRFMRLGVASASKAKEFLSGRDTATYQTYLCEKVAEIATGMLSEQINSKALSWGKDNEDTARAAYEFETGHIIKQIPFIYRDELKYFGCSPDGITDDAHGLELKCPFSSTVFVQFKCNDKIKKEYELQCMFSMWVSGRFPRYRCTFLWRLKHDQNQQVQATSRNSLPGGIRMRRPGAEQDRGNWLSGSAQRRKRAVRHGFPEFGDLGG